MPLSFQKLVSRKEFKFTSSEENSELPKLVLALTPTKEDQNNYSVYNLKEPDDWHLIFHQTAAHACHHHYLQVKYLDPTKLGYKLMIELDNKYELSCAGQMGVSLNELNEYNNTLNNYKLTCNTSYSAFEEAIYPIDITKESLALLTDTVLPEDLNDFIDFGDAGGFTRMCGIFNRWNLFVLGHNCD